MGAAASIQHKLDEATVRQIAGEYFDQAKYDEMKDEEGCVKVDRLLLAASETVDRMDEETVRLLAGPAFDEVYYNQNKELDGTIATGHLFLALGMKPPELSEDDVKKRCCVDGAFLQFCTPTQQDNITIAITAVCNRGSSLKFCSPRLQDDSRLVKLALKLDGTNIVFASPRLQDDADLIALALALLPSFSMKWEAVQMAAKMYAKNHDALKGAKIALRGDCDVIRVVVAENGLGLKYAMPYVRHERSVVQLAIAQNAQAVFFASPICMTMDNDSKGEGPIDPIMLAYVEEHFAKQDFASENTRWCPDPAAVEKMIAKFPELAKFSPPADWLSHSAERVAKEEAELKVKRDSIKQRRANEENDKSWIEGMQGAGQLNGAGDGETKEGETKGE